MNKCTHCGEEIRGIAVPLGTGPFDRQHIKCWVFLNNYEFYKEMNE